MSSLERNLLLLPAFNLFADFIAIAPVLVPWYVSHGLDATAVFTVQAVFAVSMLVLEVPSGFFADALGRRLALLVGGVVWPVGLGLYLIGRSFWAFAAAEFVIAVAVSLFSGCLSALLFDTLAALGREDEYQQREGGLATMARLGTLLASLLGGVLATRWLAGPFWLNLATFCLLPLLALALVEPARERPPARKAGREILAVARRALLDADLRPFVLGAGLLGTVGRVVIWASFLAFSKWELSLACNGLLFAILQLGGMAGGRLSAPIRARLGDRGLALSLTLVAPLLALAWFVDGWPLALVFPAITFLWNVGLPFFYDGMNRRVESRVRATLISSANLVSSLLFAVLAPVFGAVVDHLSLGVALGGLGLVAGLGLLVVVFALPSCEGPRPQVEA